MGKLFLLKRPLHSVAYIHMIIADYNAATPLVATIAKIDAAQAKIALTGSKVKITITDANQTELVSRGDIIGAIGQTAYDTLIGTTLTALNTALTGAETTANTAFAALGA